MLDKLIYSIAAISLIFFAISKCSPERSQAEISASRCDNTDFAKIGAFVHAENVVEKLLKAPATAYFASYADKNVLVVRRKKCEYLVQSYVDAQNSFGAKIRTQYEMVVIYDTVRGGYTSRDLSGF